jgi:hypothetical protein
LRECSGCAAPAMFSGCIASTECSGPAECSGYCFREALEFRRVLGGGSRNVLGVGSCNTCSGLFSTTCSGSARERLSKSPSVWRASCRARALVIGPSGVGVVGAPSGDGGVGLALGWDISQTLCNPYPFEPTMPV